MFIFRYSSLVEESSKSTSKDGKDSDLSVSEPFKMAVVEEVCVVRYVMIFTCFS